MFIHGSPRLVPYTQDVRQVLQNGDYEELRFLTGRFERPVDQDAMDAAIEHIWPTVDAMNTPINDKTLKKGSKVVATYDVVID